MAQHIALNRKEHQITDVAEALEVVQKYGVIECWEAGSDRHTNPDPVWWHGTTDSIGDRAGPCPLDLEPQENVIWDAQQGHWINKEQLELLPEHKGKARVSLEISCQPL